MCKSQALAKNKKIKNKKKKEKRKEKKKKDMIHKTNSESILSKPSGQGINYKCIKIGIKGQNINKKYIKIVEEINI